MAKITAPAEAMPVAGDDMNAENVTNWLTNIRTFLDEAGNFDEANVDLTGTDGLMGKSTAQTITGLKSLENTGAAATGILSALELGVNPASGTVTAADGPRIIFYGDDSAGNKTTLGSINVPWVTVADGATEAANLELLARIAGAVTEVVSVGTDGFILNETGVDLDYRFESDTNSNAFTLDAGLFSGVGAIGVAAAATNVAVLLIDNPALTAAASTNIAKLRLENTAAITVPAGTTTWATSLSVDEPNLTATGTITNAATVRIEAAPDEATNNYALVTDAGNVVFNETGADADFRVESDTNSNGITLDASLFTGVGAIGLAAAAVNTASVVIDNPALTATSNANYSKLRVDNTAAVTITAATTSSIVASLHIDEPNITATGTVTNAVTLYVEAAPTEGTNNYALWVDSGVARLDGITALNEQLRFDTGVAVTAGNYSVNRDADGTNQLHFNIPTGATFEWSVNDVADIVLSATRLDIIDAILELNNAVEWDTGVAVVAGEYSVGRDADGTNQLHFNVPTGATFEWSVNDVSGVVLTGGPILYINDTSNASMTIGLTLNQAANTNEIISLKSSGVTHGRTSITETDTFGRFIQATGTGGGLQIMGLTDTDATTGNNSLQLVGITADLALDTTKSTAGVGGVSIYAAITDGATDATTPGVNENLLSVRAYTTTRFILDADGDSHQDVGTAWTNFDEFNDIELIDALAVTVAREKDPLREQFGSSLESQRALLDSLPGKKIVTFNEDGHHFVNMSRLAMLQHGALRQAYRRIERLESDIKQLSERN